MNRIFSFLITVSILFSQEQPYVKEKVVELGNFSIKVLNDGRCIAPTGDFEIPAVAWPTNSITGDRAITFGHGLWLSGNQSDSLVGTGGYWAPYYTPGPIINGQAAVIEAPQDTALYRSYYIDSQSGVGDTDYDEWPCGWGAPCDEGGNPLLVGDQMLWTVYNDAHPSLHGWLEQNGEYLSNTDIEVRETYWSFEEGDLLSNTLFIKYQLYNRGPETLDSLMMTHWNDMDLQDASFNIPNYSLDHKAAYLYAPNESIGHNDLARVVSYFLIQGPVVEELGSNGFSFGEEVMDHRNLEETGFWGIRDDCCHGTLGGYAETIQDVFNYSTGRRHDGSTIIDPITNLPSNFTFTGDPITGSGWQMESPGGGMAGYMVATGPITLLPGDSTELVFGLVPVGGDSIDVVIPNLLDRIDQVRSYYWADVADVEDHPIIPESVKLMHPYPNPFNPSTAIEYELPERSDISIVIYDVSGREVQTLVSAQQIPGNYQVSWNGLDDKGVLVAGGMYFARLQAGDYSSVVKMVYLK